MRGAASIGAQRTKQHVSTGAKSTPRQLLRLKSPTHGASPMTETYHDDLPTRADPRSIEELVAQTRDDPSGDLPRATLRPTSRRHTLLLLLLCAAIYLPRMGSYGMYDPWETHYTEVARQFMVNNDWLATRWHNGTGPDGYAENNFWSKPVGSFWLSGLSLRLFGYDGKTSGETIATTQIEWAVRLPFFLCALFGIYCIYLMCSRIFGPRCGLLAGLITATAPMYFMIGRQAMTDMPYVGLMSGGLALFLLGVFGQREALPIKQARLGRWTISWPHAAGYYLFVAAFLLFMTLQLAAIISPLLRIPIGWSLGGFKLSVALVMVLYIVLSVAFLVWSMRTRTRNEIYLYGFYMAVGVAGLSKGLIGALQPGLIVLAYLVCSSEWRLLTKVALGRGLLVAACTFCPWYHGMLLRFGRAWWNELFGTEQLRRLTVGEQSQAKGTFEYYVSQVGYALFPWVAFLPAAMLRAFALCARKDRSSSERVLLFVSIWLLAVGALFTLTLTKYHHYILPIVPPAAVLIAVFLDDLLQARVARAHVGLLLAVGVLGVVSYDLISQPAHWVWMFTYLYNANWANGAPSYQPIAIYSAVFSAALLLMFFGRLRRLALWACLLVAVCVGGYVLNWYIIKCADHWSQKKVIQTYYQQRRSPQEKLIAWQFNWRGETWYTAASVVVSKTLENKKIIAWLNQRKGRRFYFITERSRYASLRNMLPTPKGKQTLRIVDDSNVHHILAVADI